MPMRIRILRSKHRPNLTHPLHIHSNSHLLEKLRALRQISLAIKVLDFKNIRASLGRSARNLRRLYPSETMLVHVLDEEIADAALELEDGLIRCSPYIKDPIV